MGRVSLCMGRYAERPFFMEKAYINLYSVEELCYCLIKNVYLIGPELMEGGLTVWLAEECGLEELAKRLEELVQKDCSLSEYVGEILQYTGYGKAEDWKKSCDTLKQEADLTIYEKRKARADYLAEHKKYVPSIKNYDSLLEELPEEEKTLRAQVLHNKGVVCGRLFLFADAADSFRAAYECGGREEDYICYLAANRMRMEETEYVDFTAGLGERYELALEVEKLMEDAVKKFEGTQESRMLFTLKVCREEPSSVSYEEELERIACGLKEHYRQITAE